MPNSSNVRILDDLQAIARAAADQFIAQCRQVIKDHGRFTVALSGGSTPKALHAVLVERSAKDPNLIDWSRVQIFFGDERHVPPDHPDSNFGMAKETLLSKVPIPKQNVHRMHCENPDAAQAATQYDAELARAFQLNAGGFPHFDLVLLGMGPDGHTASLFPGTAVLAERQKWVAAVIGAKDEARITFTYPLLESSRQIAFLVAGAEKRRMLGLLLGGDTAIPAGRLSKKRVRVFADKAATGR